MRSSFKKISKYILGIEGNFTFITLPKTKDNKTVAKLTNELNKEEQLFEKARENNIIGSTNTSSVLTACK